MAHQRPLVSVIIPNHNIENRFVILKEAVFSVLLQSYRPLEIIIVNDPGKDNTYDSVLRFVKTIRQNDDLRIMTMQLSSHQGVSVARNCGIAKANGEFMFFLDCDDLYLPGHINQSVSFLLKHHEYEWTLSPGIFSRNYHRLKKVFCHPSPVHLNSLNFEDLAYYLIEHNFPIPMGTGICCKQSIFNDSENRFSTYLSKRTAEDVHFGYKLIKKRFRPFFLKNKTVLHRSFWKYRSRSINADQACDILKVSDYITNDTVIPIINDAQKKNINTNNILKHIKIQREIFSIQSLLFRSCYKKSLFFIIKKPYLCKHWIRLFLIQKSVREPFSTLHGLYWYYKPHSNITFSSKIITFLEHVKTQAQAH